MCYMVVVALPSAAQQKWLARLPEGMHFWSCSYADLPDKMKGWQPVIVGTGMMCSCGLFKPPANEKIDGLRRKYKEQGWPQAKIERALASRKPSGFEGNLHPELRRWLAETVTEAGQGYLFVHWDYDEIHIDHETRLSTAEFQNPAYPIADEQLYHIIA